PGRARSSARRLRDPQEGPRLGALGSDLGGTLRRADRLRSAAAELRALWPEGSIAECGLGSQDRYLPGPRIALRRLPRAGRGQLAGWLFRRAWLLRDLANER